MNKESTVRASLTDMSDYNITTGAQLRHKDLKKKSQTGHHETIWITEGDS